MSSDAIHVCCIFCAICPCTLYNHNPDRHTIGIRGQMQLCVDPPFCAAHLLIAGLCTRCVRMNFEVTCINHYSFSKNLQYLNCKVQEKVESTYLSLLGRGLIATEVLIKYWQLIKKKLA